MNLIPFCNKLIFPDTELKLLNAGYIFFVAIRIFPTISVIKQKKRNLKEFNVK